MTAGPAPTTGTGGLMGLRVCVVGAGYMGSGIAQVLAAGGATVVLVDATGALARDRLTAMQRQAADFEGRGLLPAGTADAVSARTRAAADLAGGVAGADLVIEAVAEDTALKQRLFVAIAAAAGPGTMIASNTSSIPVATLATALPDGSSFFGMHWFNPAQFVPGVELIAGPDTHPAVLPRAAALLRAAGKSPVVVPDSAGFVANRLQFALFREAALIVESGGATAAEVDEVVRGSFGFRLPSFGPFAIADMAGLDVYAAAFANLQEAFGDRFAIPRSLSALVADGRLGLKSGGGYLDLDDAAASAMVIRRDHAYAAQRALRPATTPETR